MRYLGCLLVFMVAFAGSDPSLVQAAQEVTVAAASDLNFAFKEMTALFEKTTGTHVKLSLGSSGNFFSQIQNGAPYDLYFSADSRYPQKLVESGHAVASSLYIYAVGRIVLWVLKPSLLQIEQRGLDVLLDPTVKKIAIANPKHAPYGRAAVAAMEQAQVYERIKNKLVLGENVSQTAQFVESGAADIGVIALSLALAPPMQVVGRYKEIPNEAHPPLVQGAALLTGASHQVEAQAFLSFLQSAEGQAIMTRYGFVVPDKR
ncbi:MAG: Molybdate-binding periplasmic protein [Nitrospira sp.]|nr:Molybdate-binding periplasmic protein [Nitrospira sp.]